MKPIRRIFEDTGVKLVQIDAYADRGVSIGLVSGTCTVETTISQFNRDDVSVIAFDAVTLPGKIDYPITGFIVNVTAVPCVIEIAQHGT